MVSYNCRRCDNYNVVIISDYAKGIITKQLSKKIIDICNKKNKPVLVDPAIKHFSFYKKATLMTPNLKEAVEGAESKSPFYVYKEYPSEKFNLHEYINIWLELVDMYYDALEALTDEEWEKMSSVCGENAGVVIGGHFGVDTDELDKFYIIGSWQITYTFQP